MVFSVLIHLVDSSIMRPELSLIIKSMRLAIIFAPCYVLVKICAKSATSSLPSEALMLRCCSQCVSSIFEER